MTTSYPTTVDTFTRPDPTDPLNSPGHAGVHDNAYDAVEAVETKVGTTAQTGNDRQVLMYDSSAGRFFQSPGLYYTGGDSDGILWQRRFGGSFAGAIIAARALGTASSPTAVTSGTELGQFPVYGYDGSGWGTAAIYTAIAAENWNGSSHGARITRSIVDIGATSASIFERVEPDGRINWGEDDVPATGFEYGMNGDLNVVGRIQAADGATGGFRFPGGTILREDPTNGLTYLFVDSPQDGLLVQGDGHTPGITGGGLWLSPGGTGDAGHAQVGAGLTSDTVTYTARDTVAAFHEYNNGVINSYVNSGLTAGNTFTPNRVHAVGTNGNFETIGATTFRQGMAYQVASGDVQVSSTTSEETLRSVTIPDWDNRTWGKLTVEAFGTTGGSGGNKTMRIKFGSVAFSTLIVTDPGAIEFRMILRVWSRGTADTQVTWGVSYVGSGSVTPVIDAAVARTVDFAAGDVTCAITGQKASASDTITLWGWSVTRDG